MLLDNIALFLQINEKGSLAAAGREAGLSSTTVSERLAALEQHYGVVLLNRTTRAISLTDEGRTLLDGAKQVLGQVEELETRIKLGAQTLSGPIKISAPIDIGQGYLCEAIDQFLSAHPAISIELLLSDGYVDIIAQGFDLALRFGQITDSSLRVRHLGVFPRIVCASPAYLQQHGLPKTPQDLKNHNCLVMRFGETLDNVWHFEEGSKTTSVTVQGDRICNHGALVRQWALAGQGIVLKSQLDVAADIQNDKLIPLLYEFSPAPTPLQMLYPPSRAQPRRVKALANQLAERFKSMS